MEQGNVKRCGRGRPRIGPSRLVGDKGYTGLEFIANSAVP
jgi:hypothetical protein